MKKFFLLIFLILFEVSFAQPEFTEISSMPGAFSRMGFGARGIGMGNAMSAVTEGNLVSYYNPALPAFQDDIFTEKAGNSFQTSYSFLSLDRSLNFLNFTKRFDFFSTRDKSGKPRSSAGISLGIINSGVSKIDGRSSSGEKTGDLSTSENQFFIGFSNRFSEKFALGINAKFYYYKLYEEISSSGVGVDIGLLYRFNDMWNISLMISDINSKYEWDTTPIYDQLAANPTDHFPVLRKAGIRYKDQKNGFIAALDFENSSAGTNIIKAGIEFNIFDHLYLRGGIDQFNLSNSDFLSKPAFGFSYFQVLGNWIVGVDYAFMIEQYSSHDRHIVGINVNF